MRCSRTSTRSSARRHRASRFRWDRAIDPLSMYMCDVVTLPANLAGIPGMSVPCGFVDGLPVGLQVIAPRFEDSRVLRVAHAYEQATDFHSERSPLRGGIRMTGQQRSPRRLRTSTRPSSAWRCTRSFSRAPRRSARARAPTAPPQHARLPGVPGLAGRAAGAQRRGRPHGAHGARARLRHPAARVRPQELLLPGPAQGLPDQPVRRAASVERRHLDIDVGGETARIGITRVHMEEDAGQDHVARQSARVGRRSQPCRRPARRDRRRARPAQRRRGGRVPAHAARRSSSSSASTTATSRRGASAATPT